MSLTPQQEYDRRHWRVRHARGPANAHECVHYIEHGIVKQARDWAQIHGETGDDPWADYVPMCRACHIRYDGSGHHQPHTVKSRLKMSTSQARSYAEGRSGIYLVNEARRARGGGWLIWLLTLRPRKSIHCLISRQISVNCWARRSVPNYQFDWGQRLFAYYGDGDVFDYGEWSSRDMKVMFSRDGICSAVESVLTLPIREADFSIRPAKGDKGEAEFAHSVIMTPDSDGGMKTPITDLIGQITSGQIYRRAFFEKTFKIRESDGKIIYDKIAYRPPATCQARYNNRTGDPHGFRQQVWLFGGNMMTSKHQKVPGYVDIPHVRSYIYTHGKHREPLTGTSEMEVSYWCYQTKMKLLYLWYHFLENQALPRTVVYGNDQAEANDHASDIAALKSSGVVGMVHPTEDKKLFDILESGGDGGKFFMEAMNFLEGWQTHSVLAGFMALTGSATGGKGSYALSQDQSSFYLKSRQGVAKEIATSMSYGIVRPLTLLNFGPDAAFPEASFGPLQDEQIQALLTMFQTMAAAPVLHIPLPVFDMITERMASILQLDVDKVHQALMSTATQRQEQMQANPPPGLPPETAGSIGQLQGLAGAAHGIASQAAARNSGQAPRPAPPAPGPPRPPAMPPMVPPAGKMA